MQTDEPPEAEFVNLDFELIEIARDAVTRLLEQTFPLRHTSPNDVVGLLRAEHALNRLPKTTTGVLVEIGLSLRLSGEGYSDLTSVQLLVGEDELYFTRGGSQWSSQAGSDSFTLFSYRAALGTNPDTDGSYDDWVATLYEALEGGFELRVDDMSSSVYLGHD